MTTKIIAGGYAWSDSWLYGDSWGDCGRGTDWRATYRMLGDRVVSRFRELAEGAGIDAQWIPAKSEVWGEVGQDIRDGLLDEFRERAEREIADRWTNGDIAPVKATTPIVVTRADPLMHIGDPDRHEPGVISRETFDDWAAAFASLRARGVPLTPEHEAEIASHEDTQFRRTEAVNYGHSIAVVHVLYDVRQQRGED